MTLFEYVESLKNRSVAVVGIGVSNLPLIELLLERGCDVTACDKRSMREMGEEGERLLQLGAKLRLGGDYLENLDEDVIFRTPGLMPFDSHLEAARQRGRVITSEMEVFMSLCPCRIIAVTGSDGKTTTATIISEILKAAGHRVHLGGNIGHPLLCDTPDILPDDIVVLELSSFQLHSMFCRPDVAVITNLAPNHLDKHKDFRDYMDAKRSIFENQSADGKLVLNADDEHSEYYASFAGGKIAYFSDKQSVPEGAMLKDGVLYRVCGGKARAVIRKEDILLPGEHNVLNYLSAFSATEGFADDETCRKVAESFGGVEHRLEQVRVLRGVTFINDSIGTSPTRTSAGLHAMKTKPIIIAGGYDKHIPFDGLGDELCLLAKAVFLTGDTADKIETAIRSSAYFSNSGLEIFRVDDFRDTVYRAAAYAHSGDIVLLSPACAAFDRFKNFAERGRYFKALVNDLQEKDIGE